MVFGAIYFGPSDRCVVQGCSNRSNVKAGISIHNSPIKPVHRAKWKKFLLLQRKNFNPDGRFVVCSDHFESSCFARQFHMEGSVRTLSPGSVPTIWKAREAPLTDRERRRVSCQTLHFAMNFDIRLNNLVLPLPESKRNLGKPRRKHKGSRSQCGPAGVRRVCSGRDRRADGLSCASGWRSS